MSGDWFEEAIKDLDETEPDAEPAETPLETDEQSTDSKQHPDEADSDGEASAGAEAEAETTVDSETDSESATDETDPFGFDGESKDSTDTPSTATEFDADSGQTEEFGFGTGSTPEADADEPSTRPEPSMAQSPAEFGFRLDGAADSADSKPPVDSPTPGPSPGPQADPSEPTADEPDDDPFGFGTSSPSSGGLTPPMGGGDDDFGFGGFGGSGAPSPSGPEEFDDEEFESEIDRIDLGIEGLDDMILGGVPERSLIGIIGGAGTGKTTFGLQFLNQALKQGQRAVFITLEQTEEAVLSTAEEKGWPFRQYVEDEMLAIVVLDPVEMANSLASIRGDISRLIREFGASRLVLDSVSLLEMMYDHPARRRSEIFDFTRSLKEAGVTTLLTSEASEDSSHASRYGAVEYLTDAVFVLRYVRTSNFEETRLAIEIQKIRDANHSRATKPYDLTDEGMSVHKQANIF